MLTLREQAASAFAAVQGQGRARVYGASPEDMTLMTETRLENVRFAERAIVAAHGTPRSMVREPDDARLDEMLAAVRTLRAALEGDQGRWERR